MSKILVSLTLFVNVVVILAMLVAVSSCNQSLGTSTEEIYRDVFPSATHISEISISQDAPIQGRPGKAKVMVIKKTSGLLVGYYVESEVSGRSGPFKIRVLLDPQLHVKQATVISYPWDRGRDVCKRAFTRQFEGKGPRDPIRIGEDIDAMTGATISSHAMSQGVRDIIKLLKLVKEKQLAVVLLPIS